MVEISNKIGIIHGTGVDVLNEKQKQLVNRLLNEYYKRIQRQFKNSSLEAHFKNYEKGKFARTREFLIGKVSRQKAGIWKAGKAKKFSVHIRAKTGKLLFEGDAADWDLARTMHKALNKLMNRIESHLKSSDQHVKVRRPQQKRKRE